MIKAITTDLGPNSIRSFLWKIINLIYPPFCCGCGKIGFEICPDCFSDINPINHKNFCHLCGDLIYRNSLCSNCIQEPPFFNELRSFAIYQGTLQKALHRIKYQRGFGVVEHFIQPLCDLLIKWNISFESIAPVPLNPARHRFRGYNQSALIAKPISQSFSKSYIPDSLKRIKNTRSQVGLNADQRKKNMVGAFLADTAKCKGNSILLIDDIATTGTTLNECAKSLKQAGAVKVYCLTLARAFSKNLKSNIFTEAK